MPEKDPARVRTNYAVFPEGRIIVENTEKGEMMC